MYLDTEKWKRGISSDSRLANRRSVLKASITMLNCYLSELADISVEKKDIFEGLHV